MIGCGAVGTFIEVGPAAVVWPGFAYENNYDPAFTTDCNIGPFAFDRDRYLRLVETAIEG